MNISGLPPNTLYNSVINQKMKRLQSNNNSACINKTPMFIQHKGLLSNKPDKVPYFLLNIPVLISAKSSDFLVLPNTIS